MNPKPLSPASPSETFWRGRSVLVAGGYGFIGSHMVRRLLLEGARVRVADDLSSGLRHRLLDLQGELEFHHVDLADPAAARTACQEVEYVFNLAADQGGIRYSHGRHGLIYARTLASAITLLEAARSERVQRFILFSSACVYPDDSSHPTREEEAFRGAPESAHHGYGSAKRAAELQAELYRRELGMSISVLRPFNVCGPGDSCDTLRGHVVPCLIQRVMAARRSVMVFGSGTQTRSFIAVNDLVDIALRVARDPPTSPLPLNVSAPFEISIHDLIGMILRVVGKDLRVRFDLAAPEGPRRKAPDLRRLCAYLGPYEFTPLETAIRRAVDEFSG